MKLIPVYTWNKSVFQLSRKGAKITNEPWFQGVLLLICVLVAMALANIPFTKEIYHSILETELEIRILFRDHQILFPREMSLEKFINDILMVIFFFTVGLEIKREISGGELSSVKKAMLPVIAAFGGVVVPALIYTIVNHGTPGASGWGIPTATDIAFAVCILTMLGDKVPVSLKIFLTALAIADDLIAILVVALFYGGSINLPLLALAIAVIAFAYFIRKMGEKHMFPYVVLAIVVWTLFYYSGIHATMSGVVMAFIIPSKARYNRAYFRRKYRIYTGKLREFDGIVSSVGFPSGPQRHYMRELDKLCEGTMDMSYKMEHSLSGFVNFIILPLFALANAGVEIAGVPLGTVGTGVLLGLMLGKPLGITLASWIAIKLKLADKPDGASWPMFFAVACLGGIGFTMSIFVDTLSFGGQQSMEELRAAGKIAILLGSLGAGILGTLLVNLVSRARQSK